MAIFAEITENNVTSASAHGEAPARHIYISLLYVEVYFFGYVISIK